jgi:hypothetical protein
VIHPRAQNSIYKDTEMVEMTNKRERRTKLIN